MSSDDEKAPPFDEAAMVAEEEGIWNAERECLLKLYEARVLLRQLIDIKAKMIQDALDARGRDREKEKRRKGNYDLLDIQNILKHGPGFDDGDLTSELARLKRLVIAELKKNNVLEGNLAKLDLKISLLIENKGTTHDIAAKRKQAWLAKLAANHERRKAEKEKAKKGVVERFELPAKKLETYGEMFYLLQTEPRYLAKVLYLLQPQQVDAFLDSTVITLFGEAFSPREEYLILSLFQRAMEQEISVVKHVQDFLSADSVLPRLLIAYNRRMQGTVYLRTVLPNVIKVIQDDHNLDLELNPVLIHQQLFPGQNVTEDQALDNAEVQKQLVKRIKDVERVCRVFFDAIFSTLDKFPYGLRWICKVMQSFCEKQLPDTSKDDLLRLTGYFVYYRFINVALLSPEAFKIVTRELSTRERKNIIVVSKVLQKAFNLKPFGKVEKVMMPLNPFLEKIRPELVKYFSDIVQVPDPEDQLQVDEYMEMTNKEKPTIVISLVEMINIHRLIHEKIDSIASADDPLRLVLKDLGPPPGDITEADNREIQLTLSSRFKKEVKEEEENIQRYAETKEMCLPILRAIPMASTLHTMTLVELLESGLEWAQKEKLNNLVENIKTVLKNLALLEKAGLVSSKDDYQSFVHDLALEVTNRAAIRERQKKEIARLKTTLEKLKKNTAFLSEQIADYEKYLEDALRKQYEGKKESKLRKPVKFSFEKLDKMGVIVDSDLGEKERKNVKFAISVPETGIFEVVIKLDKTNQDKVQIRLDELLEKHYRQEESLEVPHFTLSVDMTLYLVNKEVLT